MDILYLWLKHGQIYKNRNYTGHKDVSKYWHVFVLIQDFGYFRIQDKYITFKKYVQKIIHLDTGHICDDFYCYILIYRITFLFLFLNCGLI